MLQRVPPGVLILALAVVLVMPCTAPQPACDAMGAVLPCPNGEAPRCRADHLWPRHNQDRHSASRRNWDVSCGYADGKRSKLLYMYVPYLAFAGLAVGAGALYEVVRARKARAARPPWDRR